VSDVPVMEISSYKPLNVKIGACDVIVETDLDLQLKRSCRMNILSASAQWFTATKIYFSAVERLARCHT
jgi:hypothetical protein